MKPLRLALLALAGSALLVAQGAARLVAEIPFSFEMANRQFAAGEYEVSDYGAKPVILLRNVETSKSAFLTIGTLRYAPTRQNEVRLVFNRYGDRSFLAEVWYPNVARFVPKSRSESALVTSTFIALQRERVVIYAKAF